MISSIPIGKAFASSIISNYGSALIENSFTSNSLSELAYNTVKEGTNNFISGQIADKIAPATTVGRKPKSFKSTIKSKRIQRNLVNSMTSSATGLIITAGVEIVKAGASFVKKTYNSAKKKVKSFFKKLFS